MGIVNKIRKKSLTIILAAVMAISVCGCSENTVENATENATENVTENPTENESEVNSSQHELNIIDDNYRNYYEIFVYSFYDSDGDGIGDLNGVTEKLDYIQDMGFNGIWLMPIMQSTTYHKYDVVDYYSVDSEYGTVDDFKNLVEECHNRGINVVIDFVINHSSSQNQWFIEACDYLKNLDEGKTPDAAECPYVDYYHFSREQVNSSYYNVSGTDWYYEGVFWSEMPDLNLENEALRTEIEDIARFWIEDMEVDGFRMDAAMHFEESDKEFNNEVLNWLYTFCRGLNPDFYMVSEVWANKATIADYYESQTPSMFNFDAAGAEGKIIKAARGNYKAASFVESMVTYAEEFGSKNPDYIDAPFITNHDMVRVSNNLMGDENDIKMACGLLMSMNGSPFVYYGEEIGMASSGQADENKRLAFIWSNTDKTGMTTGPADADKDTVSAFGAVDEQLQDENSILNYYKRAIRLRNENPEIARGDIEIVSELTNDNQAAITKTYNGSCIGIVYNTSDETKTVDIKGTSLENMEIRGELTLNNEEIVLDNGILNMPAQSICILK